MLGGFGVPELQRTWILRSPDLDPVRRKLPQVMAVDTNGLIPGKTKLEFVRVAKTES